MIAATEIANPLCQTQGTPDTTVTLIDYFPPVGDVGEPPFTTVYLLAFPLLSGGFTLNPQCKIFTDESQFTIHAGTLFISELFFIFACETPRSDVPGTQIIIQVAADGQNYSELAALFTYTSKWLEMKYIFRKQKHIINSFFFEFLKI